MEIVLTQPFYQFTFLIFNRGQYQELIVGELERNYIQIKDMYNKLQREEKED